METKELTIKEWLESLATTNQSDESDSAQMQVLLRKVGESKAVVTCGMAYLDGKGQPIDIHTLAKEILRRA